MGPRMRSSALSVYISLDVWWNIVQYLAGDQSSMGGGDKVIPNTEKNELQYGDITRA